MIFLLIISWMSTAVYGCNEALDLVFLVDGSSGVSPSDFIQEKAFVSSQTMEYFMSSKGIKIAVLLYSDVVWETLDFKISENDEAFINKVSSMAQPFGDLFINNALKAVQNLFKEEGRHGAKRVTVLITTGRSSRLWESFREARQLRNDHISLYAIGVGRNVSKNELMGLTSDRNNVLLVDTFHALFSVSQKLHELICPGYRQYHQPTQSDSITLLQPLVEVSIFSNSQNQGLSPLLPQRSNLISDTFDISKTINKYEDNETKDLNATLELQLPKLSYNDTVSLVRDYNLLEHSRYIKDTANGLNNNGSTQISYNKSKTEINVSLKTNISIVTQEILPKLVSSNSYYGILDKQQNTEQEVKMKSQHISNATNIPDRKTEMSDNPTDNWYRITYEVITSGPNNTKQEHLNIKNIEQTTVGYKNMDIPTLPQVSSRPQVSSNLKLSLFAPPMADQPYVKKQTIWEVLIENTEPHFTSYTPDVVTVNTNSSSFIKQNDQGNTNFELYQNNHVDIKPQVIYNEHKQHQPTSSRLDWIVEGNASSKAIKTKVSMLSSNKYQIGLPEYEIKPEAKQNQQLVSRDTIQTSVPEHIAIKPSSSQSKNEDTHIFNKDWTYFSVPILWEPSTATPSTTTTTIKTSTTVKPSVLTISSTIPTPLFRHTTVDVPNVIGRHIQGNVQQDSRKSNTSQVQASKLLNTEPRKGRPIDTNFASSVDVNKLTNFGHTNDVRKEITYLLDMLMFEHDRVDKRKKKTKKLPKTTQLRQRIITTTPPVLWKDLAVAISKDKVLEDELPKNKKQQIDLKRFGIKEIPDDWGYRRQINFRPGNEIRRVFASKTAQLSDEEKATISENENCNLFPYEKDATFYFEYADNRTVLRPCPDGTAFDLRSCACTIMTIVRGLSDCHPEIVLDFETDVHDTSGKNVHVGSHLVEVNNGSSTFNGNSDLTIWRFTGSDIGQQLLIKARFKTVKSPEVRQYIISNCHADVPISYSIEIDRYEEVVIFSLDTKPREKKELKLSFELEKWTSAILMYDGLKFTAIVNDRQESIPLAGDVETRSSPLRIGGCGEKSRGFSGIIDEVSVSFCIPTQKRRPMLG